jgi:GT2 family glycosyltransferase
MKTPVMVLNWNNWDDTFDCLRSLQTELDEAEVWLIDNGSRVDRTHEARALIPGVRILRWDDNYGWSGGYNRALRVAVDEGYEFAYLLNNDTVVTAGFLRPVVDAAGRDPAPAAVGSKIVYSDEDPSVQYDGEYHARGENKTLDSSGIVPTLYVCGAGMLVRLEAFMREGSFDERYFCYKEESEWSWRVIRHGWPLLAALDSVIMHRDAASDTAGAMLYYRLRNEFLLPENSRGRRRIADVLNVLDDGMAKAQQAKQAGRHDEWETIACALHDGVSASFGRRSTLHANSSVRARMRRWELRRPVDQWLLRQPAFNALTSFKARLGGVRQRLRERKGAASEPRP